ncbi:GvpL/GvpF family gas vesicle protein [Streptomyces sp. NPDC006551]|uniref:GvpL/GvpF family gas vesicle protein n=1 Tax=Streptomyces sp. NPDC006551 TaxID=3157178 RepID=UPI0033BF5082
MSTRERTREAAASAANASDAVRGAGASDGSEATLTYVYAVGRDDGALRGAVGRLTGVDGHELRLIGGDGHGDGDGGGGGGGDGGGLVALVSPVPADVFGESALRARMEDLGRLEELARAHHAVIDAAFAETVVLPLRLATVYLDERRVVAMLTEQRLPFEQLLAELDGHVELGVKVYADPASATRHAAASPPESPAAPASPGRAYLAQRRAQRLGTQDLYRAAGDIAAEARRAAEALSRARAVHRPQQGELSRQRGENLSNEAYLVPAEEVDRFRERVGALALRAPGVHVEVTGPWAPYSFATPEMGGDEGAPR